MFISQTSLLSREEKLSLWEKSLNNISFSETMTEEGVQKESGCVELRELQQKAECREKTPRRVIHFSSGETMKEYSDEDEHTHSQPDQIDPPLSGDASTLAWGPYVWFQMWRAATNTVSVCDYVGERMASLLGITDGKYQYAINEYNRTHKQSDDGDSPVSEEVESHFKEKLNEGIQEQTSNKNKLDGTESLNCKTPQQPENLHAETPDHENLNAETPPDHENLNAETPPDHENLNAETPPDHENLNAETPPDHENLNADTPPDHENLNADTPPDHENLNADTPPDHENLGA